MSLILNLWVVTPGTEQACSCLCFPLPCVYYLGLIGSSDFWGGDWWGPREDGLSLGMAWNHPYIDREAGVKLLVFMCFPN